VLTSTIGTPVGENIILRTTSDKTSLQKEKAAGVLPQESDV